MANVRDAEVDHLAEFCGSPSRSRKTRSACRITSITPAGSTAPSAESRTGLPAARSVA